MNLLLSAVVLGAVVSIVSSHPQKYSDKYDGVDIDAILKNDRVLMSYVSCVLDKGPCTQEGRDFRRKYNGFQKSKNDGNPHTNLTRTRSCVILDISGYQNREHLPEAISTSCSKCTNGQKKIVKKAAKHLMERKKSEWAQIRKKYDPKNEHFDEFMKFMAEP